MRSRDRGAVVVRRCSGRGHRGARALARAQHGLDRAGEVVICRRGSEEHDRGQAMEVKGVLAAVVGDVATFGQGDT